MCIIAITSRGLCRCYCRGVLVQVRGQGRLEAGGRSMHDIIGLPCGARCYLQVTWYNFTEMVAPVNNHTPGAGCHVLQASWAKERLERGLE